MAHTTFTQLPNVLPSYLRASLKPRASLQPGASLPRLSASWQDATFDKADVERYRNLCRLPCSNDDNIVPLLYPHAMLGPLHLYLLSHPKFPIGLVGSVHLRNHVVQYFPLSVKEPFCVQLQLSEGRRRPQGFEVDLTQEISVGGRTCWSSVSTFLARQHKCDTADAESPLASSVARIAGERHRLGSFPIPPETGVAFGHLTKDINPIHMSKFLARLFGFERDLIHGLWAVGR